MAIKIVAIVCGVSWALGAIPLVAFDVCNRGHSVLCGVAGAFEMVGFLSLIALAVMASINYARRPGAGSGDRR